MKCHILSGPSQFADISLSLFQVNKRLHLLFLAVSVNAIFVSQSVVDPQNNLYFPDTIIFAVVMLIMMLS